MWEYLASNGVSSALGFILGWISCAAYKRLDRELDGVSEECHGDDE